MEHNVKNKTLLPILAALFTALMAVFAQIQIPTPFFPITLQTFAIALCGYTLGIKYSCASVVAYILLGVAGAPTFSGFCGGFHHISGPQGGFVIAFPILALFCALSFKMDKPLKKVLIGVIGVIVMFLFGILHFMLVTSVKSLTAVVLMFAGVFLKDVLLCVFAFYISGIVRKRILKNGT